MYTVNVELKLISHMFSSGCDKEETEFRITELKALMRSTYRELFYFKDENDLKEKESKILGSTSNRSPVSLRTDHEEKSTQEVKKNYLLPRDNKKSKVMCKSINEGSHINVVLSSYNKELLKFYLDLLELSAISGGLGKRLRKGFGAFVINSIDVDKGFGYENITHLDTCKKLEKLFDKYKDSNEYKIRECSIDNQVYQLNKVTALNYNYVKYIQIIKTDKSFEDILKKISALSHERLDVENFTDKSINYKEIVIDFLGNHKSGKVKRFASPVYVTLSQSPNPNGDSNYLIIKELNFDYFLEEQLNGLDNESKVTIKQEIECYIDAYKTKLITFARG